MRGMCQRGYPLAAARIPAVGTGRTADVLRAIPWRTRTLLRREGVTAPPELRHTMPVLLPAGWGMAPGEDLSLAAKPLRATFCTATLRR